MTATRLQPRYVHKPWGRRDLAPWADGLSPTVEPVGEIIFDAGTGLPDDPELLIKVLFTAEALSVQVHPDAVTAASLGLPRGKDEAWVVLSAEPGAQVGLGLTQPVSPAALATAARDGSIAALLAARAVNAGDVILAQAGTIHAIGAGLVLIEVQQNLDLTYRLYDYGRLDYGVPRELHLDAALAVALPEVWQPATLPRALDGRRTAFVEGPSFVVERVRAHGTARIDASHERPVWAAVVDGNGTADGARFMAGEVWIHTAAAEWQCDGESDIVLAYPGDSAHDGAWQQVAAPATA
jgi:mannose-6-phosphate isomerase